MRYEVQTNPWKPKVDRNLLSEIVLDAKIEADSAIALWHKCPTVLVIATRSEVPKHVQPRVWHSAEHSILDTVNALVERLLDKGFTVDEETKFRFDWISEEYVNEMELPLGS